MGVPGGGVGARTPQAQVEQRRCFTCRLWHQVSSRLHDARRRSGNPRGAAGPGTGDALGAGGARTQDEDARAHRLRGRRRWHLHLQWRRRAEVEGEIKPHGRRKRECDVCGQVYVYVCAGVCMGVCAGVRDRERVCSGWSSVRPHAGVGRH